MSYQVLARRWRPMTFVDIVGQEPVTKTIKNAIKQSHMHHAYLFTGSRGVGKTSIARVFAKAIRCTNPTDFEPCNECANCKEILAGTSVDVIEIDGASNNSVDNVRNLIDSVKYLPASGKYKIYIVDEVHMLTTGAFNALLKTLEEPPEHVLFIFATTDPHKIPETVLSRCQRFDFKRIPMKAIENHLKRISSEEGLKINDDAINLIAREAEGGLRDSLSMLDQVISYSNLIGSETEIKKSHVESALGIADSTVLMSFFEAICKKEPIKTVEIINHLYNHGYDIKVVTQKLADTIRNALLVKHLPEGQNISDLLELTEGEASELREIIKNRSAEDMHAWFRIISKGLDDIARSQIPKTVLEVYAMKMASMENIEKLSDIVEMVKKGAVQVQATPQQGYAQAQNLGQQPRPAQQAATVQRKQEPAPNASSSMEAALAAFSTPAQKAPVKENINNANSGNPFWGPNSGNRGGARQVAPKENASVNTSASGVSINNSNKSWASFVNFVKVQKPLFGTSFERAILNNLTDTKIEIAVSPEDKILADILSEEETKADLSSLINSFFGKNLEFEIVTRKTEGQTIFAQRELERQEETRKYKNEIIENPLVQAAVQYLGIEVDERQIKIIKKD